MKKLIALVAVICIVFAVAISWPTISEKMNSSKSDNTVAVSDNAVSSSEETAAVTVDYEALYALHAPDEVVATVSGKDVEWQEYFYWLHYNMVQAQNYMDSMKAYYDMDVKWTDDIGDGEHDFLSYVVILAEDNIRQLFSIEVLGENCGQDLSAKKEAYLAETFEADKATYCGENATDADFDAFLAEQFTTRKVYDHINSMGFYFNELKNVFYGENNELVTDEQAVAALLAEGYVFHANHILFMSEDENADILAKAQALTDELRAIESNEELVARFLELKLELDEDTGKETFPEGYVFQSGVMVPEFEAAIVEMDEYEVSDPVRTSYGYHVILNLPVDPDAFIDSAGTNGRTIFVSKDYNDKVNEYYSAAEVEYVGSFVQPDLQSYMK